MSSGAMPAMSQAAVAEGLQRRRARHDGAAPRRGLQEDQRAAFQPRGQQQRIGRQQPVADIRDAAQQPQRCRRPLGQGWSASAAPAGPSPEHGDRRAGATAQRLAQAGQQVGALLRLQPAGDDQQRRLPGQGRSSPRFAARSAAAPARRLGAARGRRSAPPARGRAAGRSAASTRAAIGRGDGGPDQAWPGRGRGQPRRLRHLRVGRRAARGAPAAGSAPRPRAAGRGSRGRGWARAGG